MRVAIQGVRGAFHEIAARNYFNGETVEFTAAESFEKLFQLMDGTCDQAVMAIENTNAGSILNNYQLLYKSGLEITGEIYLQVSQHLMALPGQKMSDIKTVYSHHMAIAQCRQFFHQYPEIKLVAARDTAWSAKMINESQLKNSAAIAGRLAAELYHLEILEEHIESHKENYTRFLVLRKKENRILDIFENKMTISFCVEHKTGSLFNVLSVLNDFNANMTKLQSFPVIGEPWRYRFFVDFLIDNGNNEKLIKEVEKRSLGLKILGKYKSGDHYE